MSKRICVLGSSYIGAVYSAYKTNPTTERYEIDFYGHSNGGFPNVEIIGGHFRNVRFKSVAHSVDVGQYDAFVIYADLPSPHDVAKLTAGCVSGGCSQQVIEAVVADVAKTKTSFRLFQTLTMLTGRPVFIISANVVLISKTKMGDARHAYYAGLIENALGEGVYIPFPRDIFDEAYLPIGDFYKGSIALTGDRPADGNPGHDNHHMNEIGGGKVLDQIVAHLDSAFAVRDSQAA